MPVLATVGRSRRDSEFESAFLQQRVRCELDLAARKSQKTRAASAAHARVRPRPGEDIDVAVGLMDHCLSLNPSFARGWHWSGLLRIFADTTRWRRRPTEPQADTSPGLLYKSGSGGGIQIKRHTWEGKIIGVG